MARGAPRLQLALWCALALLCAAPAHAGALTPPLRLLPESALEVTAETSRWIEAPVLRKQLLFGAGTELVADAVLLAGGTWLGHATNNLYVSILPAVLFLALPPLATSFVAMQLGHESQTVQVRFLWAALASVGMHLGVSAVGILLGVNTNQVAGLVAFGLVDVVLTTATSVAVMDLLAGPLDAPESKSTSVASAAPADARAPDHRLLVPVFAAHF